MNPKKSIVGVTNAFQENRMFPCVEIRKTKYYRWDDYNHGYMTFPPKILGLFHKNCAYLLGI